MLVIRGRSATKTSPKLMRHVTAKRLFSSTLKDKWDIYYTKQKLFDNVRKKFFRRWNSRFSPPAILTIRIVTSPSSTTVDRLRKTKSPLQTPSFFKLNATCMRSSMPSPRRRRNATIKS